MKIDVGQLSSSPFLNTEFFIFYWSPVDIVDIEYKPCEQFAIYKSDNFWAITSKSPFTGNGLLRKSGDNWIMFRGYEVELSVSSYMDHDDNIKLLDHTRLKNGVFSYLNLNNFDNELVVKNDAFGISPLFYRKIDNNYFFSSHPALINVESDKPDLIAWYSLLQNDYIIGDRSFYSKIKRVPAGSEFVLSKAGIEKNKWFSFDSLPAGDNKINDNSFPQVEKACQKSIDKCLKLTNAQVLLPFSSGYDSRRFFASFKRRNIKFKSVTCQSFHNVDGKLCDIDAICAPIIAQFFNENCEVVPSSSPDELHNDFKERLQLIGTETFMHDWAMPLIRWLRKQDESIIFDGLGGDAFGNSGFVYDGLHENHQQDINIILKLMSSCDLSRELSKEWPSLNEYETECKAFLDTFPVNLNGAELAFLLSRTRRSISPFMTMMHPPGQLVVFPYFDLNFIESCLTYHPGEKYRCFFQKECLKRFWPDFYNFHGTRNLPSNLSFISKDNEDSLNREIEAFVYAKCGPITSSVNKFISLPMKCLWGFFKAFPFLRQRKLWFFKPLVLLVKCMSTNKNYIEID